MVERSVVIKTRGDLDYIVFITFEEAILDVNVTLLEKKFSDRRDNSPLLRIGYEPPLDYQHEIK